MDTKIKCKCEETGGVMDARFESLQRPNGSRADEGLSLSSDVDRWSMWIKEGRGQS